MFKISFPKLKKKLLDLRTKTQDNGDVIDSCLEMIETYIKMDKIALATKKSTEKYIMSLNFKSKFILKNSRIKIIELLKTINLNEKNN